MDDRGHLASQDKDCQEKFPNNPDKEMDQEFLCRLLRILL
jgi:hypothetical protein